MSCVHSALTLQESVAVGLDAGKKVYVAYFDVAKAFDSVRGKYSDWYHMEYGIHQGGFLSLQKYTAFIDPLLRILENSGLVGQGSSSS